MRKFVSRLHNLKEYDHVISVIQSAILNAQAQPWMYEVLAMEMEIQKRPKADIERVALSLSDFGQADFGAMMYSGAYLAGFQRPDAALRMYRQASRMAPEQPEPYLMALPLLKNAARTEDQQWGVTGAIEHVWTRDFAATQQAARDLGQDVLKQLQIRGETKAAEEFSAALNAAARRDVRIVIRWTGEADLDMSVEEPGGGVCSFQQRYSTGGGIFLRDGFGKDAKHCYEEYVCPRGLSGTYRIAVKTADGQAPGNRIEVEITTHEGSPEARTTYKFLPLTDGSTAWSFKLENGRRQGLRSVPAAVSLLPPPRLPGGRVAASGKRNQAAAQVAAEFLTSRQFPSSFVTGGNVVGAGGVIGFQPIIQIVPEGTQLYARAQISADRRYVRIAINPVFSTITNVFNFSFIGGAGSVQQPAQAGQ